MTAVFRVTGGPLFFIYCGMKTILLCLLFFAGIANGYSQTVFTDKNFQEKVLASDKLSVVDFWAEWCGPCRAVSPIIDKLSKEYAGKVNVGKVDVDANPRLSNDYNVTSIPTVLFIKNGKVVDKLIGAYPRKSYLNKIKQHL